MSLIPDLRIRSQNTWNQVLVLHETRCGQQDNEKFRKVCACGPILETAVCDLLLSRERGPLGTWELREIVAESLSSGYRHNLALPGYCWQSGLSSGGGAARVLVRSLMLLVTACALCSALPSVYLVKMFPQPSPDCETPAWLPLPKAIPVIIPDSPSLWLPTRPVLLPSQGLSLPKPGFGSVNFPGIQGPGNALQGWVSGISLSQVGTIPTLLGWCQDQDSPACKGFQPPAGRCL